MDQQSFVLVALVLGLMCATITSVIAKRKGRSVEGWFVLGFLFAPFAILVAAAMSREQPQSIERQAPISPNRQKFAVGLIVISTIMLVIVALIAQDPARVRAYPQALLGPALLAEGPFLNHLGQHHR